MVRVVGVLIVCTRVGCMICVYCCCLLVLELCVFFFKQKTAYEMRISDWSSDVCSSDLGRHRASAAALVPCAGAQRRRHHRAPHHPLSRGGGDRKSTRLNSSH